MTLQDWGSIGELIAAVATVVTLVYLAVQIRRSNILATAESNRFAEQIANPTLLAIVQDPEVARIFREGLGDRDSLRGDDKVRFDFLLGSLVGVLSASIADQEILGHGDSDHNKELLRSFLSAPGGKSWWTENKTAVASKRRLMIDEIFRGDSAN